MFTDNFYKLLRCQVSLFILVGTLSALLYFIVTNSIVYFQLLSPVAASVIGYLVSVTLSYHGQKKYTFKKRNSNNDDFIKFLLLSLFGVTFNALTIYFLIEYTDITVYVSTMLSVSVVAIINYFALKLWLFK